MIDDSCYIWDSEPIGEDMEVPLPRALGVLDDEPVLDHLCGPEEAQECFGLGANCRMALVLSA